MDYFLLNPGRVLNPLSVVQTDLKAGNLFYRVSMCYRRSQSGYSASNLVVQTDYNSELSKNSKLDQVYRSTGVLRARLRERQGPTTAYKVQNQ